MAICGSKHSPLSKSKMNLLLGAVCLSAISEVVLGEKEGNKFHPVISWTPPLDTSDFDNWSYELSTIALTNKIVLNPNGNERYGFIDNHFVSTSSLQCCLPSAASLTPAD